MNALEPAKSPRIVDIVFGGRAGRPLLAGLLCSWLALAVHGGLWLVARFTGPSLESWSASLAVRVRQELDQRDELELAPPPPEPPPPPPEPPPPLAKRDPVRRRSHTAPPPPAQAGRIITALPDTAVDLTGDTFVTGTADMYAGGITTARGTSTHAVLTPPDPDPEPPSGPDLSSPVRLDGDEWRCTWPREAETEDIFDQAVVIRVVVRADGSTASASVVADPGHGFGPRAMACALRTRFVPAQDRAGHAISATSPPIRVHFTR